MEIDPGAPDTPDDTARPTPMFPLESVLLPGAALPLHIFEPRYRAMITDLLAGDRRFGVALIERGREVGGGDERSAVGTLAEVVGARELPGGRWSVLAIGVQRITVRRWLPDDPYPRAEIAPWDDPVDAAVADGPHYGGLVALARRVLAMCAEVGQPAGDATTEFADDPALGTFQIGASVPLGPFDRQRLLLTEGSAARVDLLTELLTERRDDLGAMITQRGGDSDPHGA